MSLCQQCQTISTTVVHNDEEGQFVYLHSRASLQQAVADKCYFCTKVQNICTNEDLALLDSPSCLGIKCSINENRGQYGIDFSIPGKQQINFFWLQDYYDFGIPNFSNSTDDETCWQRIEKWYATCKENHPKCNKPPLSSTAGVKWLPTRLVDTHDADRGNVRVVATSTFLHATSSSSDQLLPPYLALSHCWGKQRFLTLTQQNKSSLMHSLPLSELPPNFRDAVRATRRLGFRYVWIDSLCIIQGPDGDWAEQAPLMDRVYMNAELCLAAVASEDAYGGFFRRREPADFEPFHLDLLLSSTVEEDRSPSKNNNDNDPALSTSLAAAPTTTTTTTSSSPPEKTTNKTTVTRKALYAYCGGEDPGIIWSTSVNRAPLNRRGWVQQERILAPRTVHFGQDQVYWECKMLQACEAQPDSALADKQWDNNKNWEEKGLEAFAERQQLEQGGKQQESQNQVLLAMNKYIKNVETANNHENSRPSSDEFLKAWRHIIGEYSLSGLSFEKDKLVAVSGLAKAFARQLGDEYLAGLWRSHFIKDLLWKRQRWTYKGERTMARRHEAYRAPTWSWASIEGPIEWDMQLRFEDCARVDKIVVDCVTGDTTGEVRYAEATLWGYLVPQAWGKRISDFVEFFDVDGEEKGIAEEDMMLLPLCRKVWGGLLRRTGGLLLTRAGGGDDGKDKYKRLGVFLCTDRATKELDWFVVGDGPSKITII